jgi:hypothetical protein
MSKKRISRKDWTEIGKYNYAAKWLQPLCTYTLAKEQDGRFKREQYVSWPLYILIFVPVHIAQAIFCIWDGGLKEFEINERYLGGDWLVQGSECYIRADVVWNRK